MAAQPQFLLRNPAKGNAPPDQLNAPKHEHALAHHRHAAKRKAAQQSRHLRPSRHPLSHPSPFPSNIFETLPSWTKHACRLMSHSHHAMSLSRLRCLCSRMLAFMRHGDIGLPAAATHTLTRRSVADVQGTQLLACCCCAPFETHSSQRAYRTSALRPLPHLPTHL